MEERRTKELRVTRCYECSRVEEELWMLAYEQVWPAQWRTIKRVKDDERDVPSDVPLLRSASGGQGYG